MGHISRSYHHRSHHQPQIGSLCRFHPPKSEPRELPLDRALMKRCSQLSDPHLPPLELPGHFQVEPAKEADGEDEEQQHLDLTRHNTSPLKTGAGPLPLTILGLLPPAASSQAWRSTFLHLETRLEGIFNSRQPLLHLSKPTSLPPPLNAATARASSSFHPSNTLPLHPYHTAPRT